MKTYLAYILTIASLWTIAAPLAVAKPKTGKIQTVAAPAVISPAAALNRLIVAEKLAASWFTPEFLKAVDKNSDVNAVQIQRDLTMKLARFRYGKYKSVQPIGGNKYRVLFDRAEPDAAIVQMSVDARGRIASIGITEKNKPAPNPQAQVNAKASIERAFKTNTGSDGKPSQIIANLQQWMGNHQKTEVAGSIYSAILDRGSIPITVEFNEDGSVKRYGIGCPVVTKSLSLSQAHPDLQKLISKCPNLKS